MRRRPHIALLIETSNDYARGLLHGIHAYSRQHGPWSMFLREHGRGDRPPSWLKDWQGDGIIARIETPAIADAVAQCNLPTVDVSAARLLPDLPWIETDDQAIGRLAADHMLERGFQHFGYFGEDRFNWSQWREKAFRERIEEAEGTCHIYQHPETHQTWEEAQASIAAWIESLPKPVGVMACYDIRGQMLIDACREIGVRIPDEVAVLGVDNDELLCELCDPPMSSVEPDTYRTGFEAAEMLDRMIQGENLKGRCQRIEPIGVIARQSSDVLAISDREIAAALHYIREHACDGINVMDLLKITKLSRRVFESRFKSLLGRTPHEQIQQVKLDRAKLLLSETDMPMTTIAERTGFKHSEYLTVVFRKKVGVPPSIYRRRSES